MINVRHTKESKFSLFTCFVVVVVLNIELFLFFTDQHSRGESSCDVEVKIIYPNKIKVNQVAAQLLNKWKNTTENQFTIISVQKNIAGGIIIAIPLIDFGTNEDFNGLLTTISSISNHTTEDEKLNNTLIIIFESNFKYYGFVQKILLEFSSDIVIGFLQIIKVPVSLNNDSLFTFHHSDIQANHNKHVMFMSLCLLSEASVYLSSQGSYIWLMNEDVEILGDKFITDATKFIKKITKPWSILDFSDHMSGNFTGKLIRVNDLNKFAYFFVHLLSQPYFKESEESLYEAHLNYLHLMYQSNFITFKPNLMLRRSQVVTGTDQNLHDYLKTSKYKSDDPSGVIVTSMSATDFKHSPMRAYGSLPNHYFEAQSSKYGDWFAIVFDEQVHLEKVILELGYRDSTSKFKNGTVNVPASHIGKSSLKNSSEFVVEGILEASPKLMKLDVQKNVLTCGDYIFLGNIQGPIALLDNLQDKLKSRPTKCLKLTFSSVHATLHLIIRQIAVFSDD